MPHPLCCPHCGNTKLVMNTARYLLCTVQFFPGSYDYSTYSEEHTDETWLDATCTTCEQLFSVKEGQQAMVERTDLNAGQHRPTNGFY